MKVQDIYGTDPISLTGNITEYVDSLKAGAANQARLTSLNITDIQIFHLPNGCDGHGLYSWVAYVKYYE